MCLYYNRLSDLLHSIVWGEMLIQEKIIRVGLDEVVACFMVTYLLSLSTAE